MKGDFTMDVKNAYNLFTKIAKPQDRKSLFSIEESDECFSFFTDSNETGVYNVFKETGEVELEPYWLIVLKPRKSIRSYEPKELERA